MYLQSESLYFTGGGSNFFSEGHFTEKREIGVSDADRLVFEEITECIQD